MCDYSLEAFGSRPANEFEQYVTTRFPSGSVGLTVGGDSGCAVCVQYETRLCIEGLPKELQTALGVGPIVEAKFIRLDHGPYHDGVQFENGRKASLQQIGPSVGVIVTQIRAPVAAQTDQVATA